jgi:uncharacterized protein YecE (DUF72 family)
MERAAMAVDVKTGGQIRVGIGGWTFPPWRGTFYPDKLPQAKELDYAASKVTGIEINATFYGRQKPESFRKWAASVPDGFQFALKASRFCTTRKVLGEAGEGIERFLDQGLLELGDRLGPILWQFQERKAFEPDDFAAFLKLLPQAWQGVPLRHAIEVRHESFRDPAFVALCRAAHAAIVFSDTHLALAEQTADFAYARLTGAREDEPEGYAPAELDRWADATRGWAEGRQPDGVPALLPGGVSGPRDAYVFAINGAKVRAPAVAQALLARVRASSA